MLKNYRTKISAMQSAGEIQSILASHGAKKIMTDYEGGHIIGINFIIDTPLGARAFMLPARVDGVAAALAKQGTKCDYAHAENVAWRILKDWVAAQMAFLESEQAALDEIFLPYMVNREGKTMYELLVDGNLVLPEGKHHDLK